MTEEPRDLGNLPKERRQTSFLRKNKLLSVLTLANPRRFMAVSRVLRPVFLLLAIVLVFPALVLGLFVVPPDFRQGEVFRIIYVHVPSAYLATLIYLLIALCSVSALVWKHSLADLAAKAASPIGLLFAFLTLVTGGLWGQPTWGTYWEWDPRLTSVLVLFFLYIGHNLLFSAFDNPATGRKAAAFLACITIVILPLIRYSISFATSLHQDSTRLGASLDPQMRGPFLAAILGMTFFFFWLWFVRIEGELLNMKRASLQRGLLRTSQKRSSF